MEEIIIGIIEWLKQFSYLGIVLALSIEFIPAELFLPLVGYWVYQGEMNFTLAVLAGSVGGTFGPLTLYGLGRYFGRPFIIKYGKYFFIKKEQLEKSEQFFNKHGSIIAFSGRFIPGIRTLISIPCGISKMNVFVFSLYTFLAMLPITTLYIYLGKKFAKNWKMVEPYAQKYMFPFGVIIICLFLYFIIQERKKCKQK